MDNPRWWHVATAALGVVLTVLVLFSGIEAWRQAGALIALGVLVVGWFVLGTRAFVHQPTAIVFTVVIVIATGAAVGFLPIMAIMQTVAYPLVWTLSRGLRDAVIANVAVAAAVGVGFWASTGDLPQTLVTVSLSLAFSLAFGLWITRIAERSEERQRLLDELRATQDRLTAVSRDAGVASERERLAREIHDTIAQDLTGLVMLAQQVRRDLTAGDAASALERVVLIEDNARTTLAETRALVAASAPPSLASGDLRDALDRLAERFTRETGTIVTVSGASPGLDRAGEVVLLRCAQEGLANVRKHAGAGSATLTLDEHDGVASLTIVDDGHGFDTSMAGSGFGLGGMRDRLALVGGDLAVESSVDGTRLVATLPTTVGSTTAVAPSIEEPGA